VSPSLLSLARAHVPTSGKEECKLFSKLVISLKGFDAAEMTKTWNKKVSLLLLQCVRHELL
jgi:hypothetical protein